MNSNCIKDYNLIMPADGDIIIKRHIGGLYMDWSIFWSAFGAIGTTLGSLLTAGAIIIAVKQYRQPLKKAIKIEFSSAFLFLPDEPFPLVCITVKNKGIRALQIDSINIKGNKKKIWINNAQYNSSAKVGFPAKIEPEECIKFLFEEENFRNVLRKAVKDKVLRKKQRLVIFVTDSLGENYYCKTKIPIQKMI